MKRFVCLILLVATVLGCTGCGGPKEKTIYCMDTVMQLQVWGTEAVMAIERLEALLMDQEKQWSATDPESLLNTGAKNEALMTWALALSERTGGAYDPHLGAVTEAWGFYDKNYRVPTQKELKAALAEEKWDMGGIAKGNAGSLCVRILETFSVDRALLNLGGNIQTYGTKADGSPWIIGIQNPDGGDYICTVEITGTMAVVTSGDYQRYFEQDGKRYHHIFDPKTGMPVSNGLRSVTVICQDGATADALSTALFVMGLEEGTKLWQESTDFEAIFVTAGGVVYATEGLTIGGRCLVIDREN